MKKHGNLLVIVLLAITILALSVAGYFFLQNQQLKNSFESSRLEASPSGSFQVPPDQTANWKTYQDKNFGIYLKYPDGIFKYQDPEITDLMVYTSRPVGGNGPKFLGPNDLWLEAHLNKFASLNNASGLLNFINSNPELAKAEKAQTTVNGDPAYKLYYHLQTAAAGNYSVTEYIDQAMILHNTSIYTVNLSSWNKQMLDQSSTLFDQILSTFKILDQQTNEPMCITLSLDACKLRSDCFVDVIPGGLGMDDRHCNSK